MRLVTTALTLALATALPPPAPDLRPEAVAAWDQYVALTEARIARELDDRGRFLVHERLGQAGGDWRARARRGEVVLRRHETRGPDGRDIDVPDARIHHWVGVAFFPGVALDDLLRLLQTRWTERWSPDVVEARLVWQAGNEARTFLRLRQRSVITVTYDTEHLVRYDRLDASHAVSRSTAIRIAQIADAGTPRERALPPGQDHGFLWRLNAYWRYDVVDGGLLVELESLTLSREVPWLLVPVAEPIVRRLSRDSVTRTLSSLRDRARAILTEEAQRVGRPLSSAPREPHRSSTSR
jgi:hypothetical protein